MSSTLVPLYTLLWHSPFDNSGDSLRASAQSQFGHRGQFITHMHNITRTGLYPRAPICRKKGARYFPPFTVVKHSASSFLSPLN